METKNMEKPEFYFGPDAAEEQRTRHLQMYAEKLRQSVRVGEVDHDRLIELVALAKGGRSQRKFADDMGVNVSSISRILSGKVTEISNDLIAKIVVAADPNSGVTLDKLMEAQGIVSKENRFVLHRKYDDNCRRIFLDELLQRGYSVSYPKEQKRNRWDIELVTNALPHGEGRWLVDSMTLTEFGRFPVATAKTKMWLNRAMAYYYMGGVAGRISLIIDHQSAYEQLKERLSAITIKDEISVILISTATGKILDEYVAPLTDGREGKVIFSKAE